MLRETENFPFQQWIAACPPRLQSLKARLRKLQEFTTSLGGNLASGASPDRSLKTLLDNAIDCWIDCDQQLNQSQSATESLFIGNMTAASKRLIGVLSDQLDITNHDILTIKFRRWLDSSYMPNHLPNELLGGYVLPGKITTPLQLDAYIAKYGLTLKKGYRRDRCRQLRDLLCPTFKFRELRADPLELEAGTNFVIDVADRVHNATGNLVVTGQNFLADDLVHNVSPGDNLTVNDIRLVVKRITGTQVHCLVMTAGTIRTNAQIRKVGGYEPKLLNLQSDYVEKEALPKFIKSNIDKLPSYKPTDLPAVFDRIEACLKDIDHRVIPEEGSLRAIKQELLRQFTIIKRDALQRVATRQRTDEERRHIATAMVQNSLTRRVTAAERQTLIAQALLTVPRERTDLEQALLTTAIVNKARNALSKQLLSYLPQYKKLRAVRSAIINSLGPMNPGELLYYKQFQAQKPIYFSDDAPASFASYLSDSEREPFRIHIINGKFYRFYNDGPGGSLILRPLSTSLFRSHSKEGWIAIVMNSRGELFGDNHHPGSPYYHSSYMRGAPVIFAGEVKISDEGELDAVSNYSGHYLPNFHNLEDFAIHLSKRKVNLTHCKFIAVDDKTVNERIRSVQGMRLPAARLRPLKYAIIYESEKLKFSTYYRLENNRLVSILTPGKIVGAVALGVVSVLAVAACATLVVATHGLAIPILTSYLLTAPAWVSSLAIAGTGLLGIIPALAATKLLGGFEALKNRFSSMKKAVGKFFSPKTNQNPAVVLPQGNGVIPMPQMQQTHTMINLATSAPLRPAEGRHSPEWRSIRALESQAPSKVDLFGDLPVQMSLSAEDKEFQRKRGVTGKKTDYPQWNSFETNINRHLADPTLSYQSTLDALERELTQMVIQRAKHNNERRYLEPCLIWTKQKNVLDLFGEIAVALLTKNQPDRLQHMEQQLFKPAIAIIKRTIGTSLEFGEYERRKPARVTTQPDLALGATPSPTRLTTVSARN